MENPIEGADIGKAGSHIEPGAAVILTSGGLLYPKQYARAFHFDSCPAAAAGTTADRCACLTRYQAERQSFVGMASRLEAAAEDIALTQIMSETRRCSQCGASAEMSACSRVILNNHERTLRHLGLLLRMINWRVRDKVCNIDEPVHPFQNPDKP